MAFGNSAPSATHRGLNGLAFEATDETPLMFCIGGVKVAEACVLLWPLGRALGLTSGSSTAWWKCGLSSASLMSPIPSILLLIQPERSKVSSSSSQSSSCGTNPNMCGCIILIPQAVICANSKYPTPANNSVFWITGIGLL